VVASGSGVLGYIIHAHTTSVIHIVYTHKYEAILIIHILCAYARCIITHTHERRRYVAASLSRILKYVTHAHTTSIIHIVYTHTYASILITHILCVCD